jgi:VanZ family protein
MTTQLEKWLRYATFWGLVAYWLALFVATHWPREIPVSGGISDKILHFTAYAILAALLGVEVWWRGHPLWIAYSAIFLGLAIFGAFDELTQPLVNRSADWLDWYADVAGILSGLVLARIATVCLSCLGAMRKTEI